MYSINVFVTFSLSMLAMGVHSWRSRRQRPAWRGEVALFGAGFTLCGTILGFTLVEKFAEGGWLTILVTGIVVGLCFRVRGHYRSVGSCLKRLYDELTELQASTTTAPAVDSARPTAAILVSGFGGLGIHTLLHALRAEPGKYRNVVFLSVGVIDSGAFKGADILEELRVQTEGALERYVALASGMGLAATSRSYVGTDAAHEAEQLCLEVAAEFPTTTFFAGKHVFEKEEWYHRLLHNETAYDIQRRLKRAGHEAVIVPARLATSASR
jgi:K+ transporter